MYLTEWERQSDISRATMPGTLVNPEWQWRACDRYLDFISKAKENINIVTGEAYPGFYSLSSIQNAFRETRARGVVISMITGPVLPTHPRSEGPYSGVVDLVEQRVITLYVQEKIGIIEGYKLLDPHNIDDPDVDTRMVDFEDHVHYDDRLPKPPMVGDEVTPYIEDFGVRLRGHNIRVVRNPRQELLLADEDVIRAMIRFSDTHYSELSLEEIRQLHGSILERRQEAVRELQEEFRRVIIP